MPVKAEDSVFAQTALEVRFSEHPPAYESTHSHPRLIPPSKAPNRLIVKGNTLVPSVREEEPEETRVNVSLINQHLSVYAKCWVVPGRERETCNSMVPPTAIVRINAQSTDTKITLIVRDNIHTNPLRITCGSVYAKVRLYLPRSFVGMIRASSDYGKIKFSQELRSNGTLLHSMGKTSRIFIGNMKGRHERGISELDDAEVSAPHAGLAVYFEDEMRHPPSNPWTYSVSRSESGLSFKGSLKKLFSNGRAPVETMDPSAPFIQSPSPSQSHILFFRLA
ncbi:hypothetical protein DL96DRAFT_1639520 [Flagelloscypha sp. PMI_526]|nr:hypothetical protein DL96DRAFT_1639520 [Flagelloscypha sp. PMI_526]